MPKGERISTSSVARAGEEEGAGVGAATVEQTTRIPRRNTAGIVKVFTLRLLNPRRNAVPAYTFVVGPVSDRAITPRRSRGLQELPRF